MSNKIKWVIGIIVLIAIVWFGYLNKTNNSDTSNETIKIGYIGPMTGGVAILGTEALGSIEVAVEKANAKGGIDGKMIEIIAEDDQYDTAKSVTAYEKLTKTDKVETIIMSTYGGVMAVAEKAKKDNVLIIDSLDCDEDIANLNDNIFCIAKETKDLADVIADEAIKKGYKNIAIVHATNDNFMQSVADAFVSRVGNKAVFQVESYTPQTTDFKTPLLKIKDKNVDAVVFLGYDEIGIAIKQAKELGLDKPYLTIPSVATTPSIQDASKGAIDGIYFSFYAPLETNPVATKFYQDFEAKFGHTPYVFVASDQAYDTAQILINEVLPKVTGKTQEKRIAQKIDLLQDVKNYKGVTGNLTMKEDGRIDGILIRLFQLQDMKPVYVGK